MDFNDAVEKERLWLLKRGYDGRYLALPNEACGCGVDDLRPCGHLKTGCRPAKEIDGWFYPTLRRRSRAHLWEEE